LEDSTPVTLALQALNIPHRLFRHPGQVRSLEQAAQERGQKPDQIVRSIVFRLAQDDFIMVLITGERQVAWPALRSYLGQSRLTMASEEEVRKATGYPLGAVSPFCLPAPMRLLVDQSVLDQENISIGSGERNSTVFLKVSDLMKALGPVEVGSFAQEGD